MATAYDERLGVPAALVGAGHDAGRQPLAGAGRRAARRAGLGGHRASRWRCWPLLLRRLRRAPGSSSPTACCAPAGPASRPATSAPASRSTPSRPAARPGVEADARAFLLLRPYLTRAVRVRDHRPGRPRAVLAGRAPGTPTSSPARLGAAADRRRRAGAGARVGAWPRRTPRTASDSSKIWSVFSLVSALGAAAVAKKALNTDLEGRDRQEAARRTPPTPTWSCARRWPGRSSAARSSAWPGCSPSAGRRRTTPRSTGHLPPGLRKDGQ